MTRAVTAFLALLAALAVTAHTSVGVASAAPAGAGSLYASSGTFDPGAPEETAGTDGTQAVDDGAIVENDLGTADDGSRGSSKSEDRKIWAIIGGLLLVAVALTVLTVRYWRQTRPVPRPSTEAPAGRRARSSAEPVAYDDLGSDLFVDGD